jgi:hypothetical protein
MMSRQQRIEYEILDFALKSGLVSGHPTSTRAFTQSLRWLFPNVQAEEFIEACQRLIGENRLDVQYLAGDDAQNVFEGRVFLKPAALSHDYFQELQGLIEMPTFQGWGRP